MNYKSNRQFVNRDDDRDDANNKNDGRGKMEIKTRIKHVRFVSTKWKDGEERIGCKERRKN